MKYNRIMLAGPSGFGKTTLAKWLSEQSLIPFESGSVSDLIPKTKDILHKDMLSRDPKELYLEDFQIINLRNKLFGKLDNFVSDRSYLDSAAYFIYKQAVNQPSCEIEHFLETCGMLLTRQCDCLILLNFLPELVNEWVTEDNNKRITNNYFQIEISSLMKSVLPLIGHYKKEYDLDYYTTYPYGGFKRFFTKRLNIEYGIEIGTLHTLYGKTKVLIINEPNLEIRKNILREHVL